MFHLLLALTVTNFASADKVRDLCTNSKVLVDPKDYQAYLSRFPDPQACGIGQDTEVEKLSSEIIGVILKTVGEIKSRNKTPDTEILIGAIKQNGIFDPLDKLAELVEKTQLQKTPISDPDVLAVERAGQEFKAATIDFENASVEAKTQELEKLKALEKKYVEAAKGVMRKTNQGRKALQCYERPSPEVKARLPNGKMPDVRLTSVLLFEEGRPRENQIGGSFASTCTHVDPPTFKTELNLNPEILKPMQVVYELTHEMTHACDMVELGNSNLELKRAQDAKIPDNKLGSFKKVTEALGIENLSQFGPTMRNFTKWISSSGPARPMQPGQPMNPLIQKFENAKKILTENSLSLPQLQDFVKDVMEDPELNASIKRAEQEAAFVSAKAEIKAFQAATQMFKELAALDPAYCQMVDGGVTFYGPTLFSPADFFRTLEEGNLVQEVMRTYSLKSGAIPQEYIYKMDPTKGGSVANQILRDANGTPIFRDEFNEFLSKAGF